MDRRRRRPPERRYDWTLEFAWAVRTLRPWQQAHLLANLRAAYAQRAADPSARRVIWVEDERGCRRPYTPADDVGD
jgi:hypothetical protein